MDDRLTDTTQAQAPAARIGLERHESHSESDSLVALRARLWKTLLGYHPCVAGICDLVDAFGDSDATASLTDAVRRTACVAARDALAEELGRRDGDLQLADLVLADLTSHEMGEPDQASMIRLSDDDCAGAAFVAHVHASRALYSAVWLARAA